MKNYISLIVFLISLSGFQLSGQEMERSDMMGNKYSWKSHELIKKNSNGEFLFSWQNPAGGKITWIDPIDPFRILVYSKESNQLLWLDNKLSPLSDPVNLDEHELIEVSGICSSKDGGFWVFEKSTGLLIKLNQRFKKEISAPIRIKLSNSPDAWLHMKEWKQELYLLIPQQHILVADLFGQVIKRIPVKAKSFKYLPKMDSLNSLIKKP